MTVPVLHCGRHRLTLDVPRVMGVINVTPDSFSDGGRFLDPQAAAGQALRLIEEGADIIDIGGESTRPGSDPVSEDEELARVMPVMQALAALPVPVSVDTRRPRVMRAVLAAGASMINDIEALQAPGALEAVAASDCAVCLMHMQGQPGTMQHEPHYGDVVAEVAAFLAARVAVATAAGIGRSRLVLDPGFGFGKNKAHNLELLRRLPDLHAPDIALLAGLSRKSMLGAITGRPVGERAAASVSAALIAVQRGARIVRVHDVAATRDALTVWQAVEGRQA